MATQIIETQRVGRRPYFAPIRWGAVFAGLVSGTASYMLLTLLGIAVGLTVAEPQAGEQVGAISIGLGIWTLVSMIVAAFLGGYVAANMSGLMRRNDGLLHGFVAWGAIIVLFVWLATTAMGTLLGGAFSAIGQDPQAVGQAIGEAAPTGQQVAQVAEGLTAASWWLFFGLLLSLVAALIGGASGARATTRRAPSGHGYERESRVEAP